MHDDTNEARIGWYVNFYSTPGCLPDGFRGPYESREDAISALADECGDDDSWPDDLQLTLVPGTNGEFAIAANQMSYAEVTSCDWYDHEYDYQ